jgi:hypothetical protein
MIADLTVFVRIDFVKETQPDAGKEDNSLQHREIRLGLVKSTGRIKKD